MGGSTTWPDTHLTCYLIKAESRDKPGHFFWELFWRGADAV